MLEGASSVGLIKGRGMMANEIPPAPPLGSRPETLWLVISIATYVLALGGVIAYLLWKLPKDRRRGKKDRERTGTP